MQKVITEKWEAQLCTDRGLPFIEDSVLYNAFIELIVNKNLEIFKSAHKISYKSAYEKARGWPKLIFEFNKERPSYYYFNCNFYYYRQDPNDIIIELYQLETLEVLKLLEIGTLLTEHGNAGFLTKIGLVSGDKKMNDRISLVDTYHRVENIDFENLKTALSGGFTGHN